MKPNEIRKSGVKITIKNLQNRVPVDTKRVKKTVQKVLSQEGIKKSVDITLCFVNDAKIKELNSRYLGKNRPTDVIAFDLSAPQERKKILGDIAISTERAIANARDFHTSVLYELYLYVIHGVLHILGYDDKNKKKRTLMRRKEKQILEILGLSS